MPSFRLASNEDMQRVLEALDEIPLDGSHVVKISDKKASKSERQRKYQWLLYNTIAKSGKGNRESAADVDLDCKYMFRNVWFQDDEDLHRMFALVVNNDMTLIKKFCKESLHTESLNTKEMGEYLDSILTHYGHDIVLPHPEDLQLLEY